MEHRKTKENLGQVKKRTGSDGTALLCGKCTMVGFSFIAMSDF
jgi:hypothetical protein